MGLEPMVMSAWKADAVASVPISLMTTRLMRSFYNFSRNYLMGSNHLSSTLLRGFGIDHVIHICIRLERMTGLEPVTLCLASIHSTTELHPHVIFWSEQRDSNP